MKVLFYSPLAALSYHFETDLELIKQHQDQGDEVFVIGCDGDLKKVGFFGCNGFMRCSMCISKWNQGMNYLQIPNEKRASVSLTEKKRDWEYNSREDVVQIEYKNVDIGSAVLSTLISNIRESNPEVLKYKNEIDNMLDGMVSLVDWIENLLDSQRPDLIYLFNGRFSLYRPMLRISQNKKINFYVHERAGKIDRFSLTPNNYPHDLDSKKKEIQDVWLQGNDTREELAKSWFETRRSGAQQSWYSFTDKQKMGLLPAGFNVSNRNVAIFISSEDEFAVIQGWENPFFNNQLEGIKYILDAFKENLEFHFYIRIHPNLKGLKNSQTSDLNKLNYSNLTILQADDPVNSYNLLEVCEKVVTFGSTIGAEAVYAGKPSILIGRTFYEDLDGPIKPKSKEEIIEIIKLKQVISAKSDILKYGYWFIESGKPFKFFKPTSLSTGLFLGKKITGNRWIVLISYVYFFFYNLSFVFRGKMSWGFLWNRTKNKIFG